MTRKANTRIRVAVCGMGMRGIGMTRMILRQMPDVEVVGLADCIPERAAMVPPYLGIQVPTFTAAGECLDATQAEALLVFTTDAAHAAAAVPALKRDVHVFCEKPMATTLADCDRIIAAARKSKASFYMGFNLRHAPFSRLIHDIVRSGELGDLLTLTATEYYHGGRTYFRRWNRLKSAGGGLWLTKSSHDFDLLRWLVGTEPEALFAVGGRKLFRPKPGAGPRCRECRLAEVCPDYQPPEVIRLGTTAPSQSEMDFWTRWQEAGEAAGYLPFDACLYRDDTDTVEYGVATIRFAGDVAATYALNVATTRQVTGRWLTVIGTKGAISTDPPAGLVKVSSRAAVAPRTYDVNALSQGGHGGADDRIVADFIRTCREGRKPVAGWEDGRRAVELGLAATRSQERGVLVNLPLRRQRGGA